MDWTAFIWPKAKRVVVDDHTQSCKIYAFNFTQFLDLVICSLFRWVGQQKCPISVHLVCHPPKLNCGDWIFCTPWKIYMGSYPALFTDVATVLASGESRLLHGETGSWHGDNIKKPRKYPREKQYYWKKLDITKPIVVSFIFNSNFENFSFKRNINFLCLLLWKL